MLTLVRWNVTIVALAMLVGCDEARPTLNAPLTQWDMASGYRFATLAPPGGDNSDILLIFASFSGGGTLAFEALQELARQQITWEGKTRRLLDELDVIYAVSGGTFTGGVLMHCCTRETPSNAVLVLGASSGAVLFENVRIFDGNASRLSGPSNVLVTGNVIAKIASTQIADPAGMTVQRIEGGGRTLMPGLIDNHWHTMFARPSPAQAMQDDIGYTNLLAGAEAETTLMRGFTTVRDLGGPSFGLKRAIDEGLVVGPRIYPSGAMITITGGHGDFRSRSELPRQIGGPLSQMERMGGSMVADSPDEVRVRVREQLLLGASQIKLTAGGGVASPHSPLDVSTFTAEELKAAVEAAENWGTYVAVHAYTPVAIKRAVAAGVKVIEHGHLMDEASAKLMADNEVWLSFQPFTDDGFSPPMAPANRLRLQQVWTGTERTIALTKKYKIKIAFGTDILFSAEGATRQGAELAKMSKWYSPAEALTMATRTNGELLKLSGPRDPYPGKLGVIEEGALADLLLVNGDPLTNISLLEDSARNLVLIMKDGKIYKNLLPSTVETLASASPARM